MSNYRVTVERKRTEVVVLDIEAPNEGAAETRAIQRARDDLDWDLDDEDFDIRETVMEDEEDEDEEDEDEEEFEEEDDSDED